MQGVWEHFFTHKDFLRGSALPGRLFSPLHLMFSACVLAAVVLLALLISKRSERTRKRILLALWGCFLVLEVVKTAYETLCGAEVRLEVGGILPFYPCSVYLYTLPFCFVKNERVRTAACGYLFTVGLIGAATNFVYPVNVLSNYSCISFMGFHTLFFHGTMLFTTLLMLLSGYHTYRSVTRWRDLVLPALPLLILSIPANLINYSPVGSDYMFFKCDSFFLPAIVGSLSDIATTAMVYGVYLVVPAVFYLPGLIMNRKHAVAAAR